MSRTKSYHQRKDRHVMIDQDVIVLVNFGSSGAVRGIHPAIVMSRCRRSDSKYLVIPLFRSESFGTKVPSVRISQSDCQQLHFEMYAQPMMLQSIGIERVIRRVGIVNSDTVHKDLERLLWEEVSV